MLDGEIMLPSESVWFGFTPLAWYNNGLGHEFKSDLIFQQVIILKLCMYSNNSRLKN